MQVIEKPWGKEELIAEEDEYIVKRLFMIENRRCSLQYHKEKTETIYVISGKLLLTIDDEEFTMLPGEFITILPTTMHRMEALIDTIYLECSTTELDDVIRVEDDYGRE